MDGGLLFGGVAMSFYNLYHILDQGDVERVGRRDVWNSNTNLIPTSCLAVGPLQVTSTVVYTWIIMALMSGLLCLPGTAVSRCARRACRTRSSGWSRRSTV